MYVLPKCHKKSAMIKSNPSCSVRNACRVHFRHRHINSFTFSKSNIFKTLNWSWKFFLFLCQFLFSHSPMNLFPSSYVTLAWLKFNVMFSYNLSSCKRSFCILHLSLAVQCCYYIHIPIALNKTTLDVYNAMVYEALSGSHLISLAYMSICFSQLFVGEGFNTTVKCPISHHYR
jgi:hypothetical protein